MLILLHRGSVEDNEAQSGVLNAFRMAGFLAFVPCPGGWREVPGPEREELPVGSARMADSVLEYRLAALRETLPAVSKSDWKRHTELRNHMREAAAGIAHEADSRGTHLTPCHMVWEWRRLKIKTMHLPTGSQSSSTCLAPHNDGSCGRQAIFAWPAL